MKSYELVAKTIRGENTGRTPVYGWVKANLEKELAAAFGSPENFEDHYDFDMAHLFGGPEPYNSAALDQMRKAGTKITPELLLSMPLNPVNNMAEYAVIIKDLDHHRKQRYRFCYVQTPGIFECLNAAFGIEDHLCYMALYPDELKQVYLRQAEWNSRFASNMMDLGVDMVHISDDWGAQKSLLFSMGMWKELIYPCHKATADCVKGRGVFLSLHSDGNIQAALDGIVELGYDVLHPWQESAGMPYEIYLQRYQQKFAVMGGLCIQTMLGFGNYSALTAEIDRIFSLLKGKRWLFCTTHFVQEHCTMEELVFAYDHIVKLARG